MSRSYTRKSIFQSPNLPKPSLSLLVMSEGLQKSLDAIDKYANDWRLKENIKKSNIMTFSGNGQNKQKVSFKYQKEFLNIACR